MSAGILPVAQPQTAPAQIEMPNGLIDLKGMSELMDAETAEA